jgi:hypothetical protein
MTAIGPHSISWREPHQKALGERDLAKLVKQVYATEEALFLRWQELYGGSGHDEELREMTGAAQDVLRMQTEKMGWPSPGLQNCTQESAKGRAS